MLGREIWKHMESACGISWTVTSSDRLKLLKRPCVIISNTDESTETGQHWIALYLNEQGYGECFDSYGRHPDRYHANFARFMNEHCRVWVYNDVLLQGPFTKTCGHYCVVYAVCKCNGHSMEKVVHAMKKAGEGQVVIASDSVLKC